MNIELYPSFWFTLIDLPIDSIHNFLLSDYASSKYTIVYDQVEVDKFYLENLHEKPELEFYGVLYYNPVNAPNKTIAIGNAGSWGTLSNYICKNLSSGNFQFDMNSEQSKIIRNTLLFNEKGKTLRSVQCLFSDEDNEWVFFQKGDPLWFENTTYYERQEVNTRLNKDILIEYCEKLGLQVRQDDFFRSDQKSLFVKHQVRKK
jgi:hypothetical protein